MDSRMTDACTREGAERMEAEEAEAKNGIERIAAERARQIAEEGWTPEHDDEHTDGSLALAAVCYAAPVPVCEPYETAYGGTALRDPWPQTWDRRWDKRPHQYGTLLRTTPEQRIRLLEKAGALIAAEIDRLLRATKGRP